MPTMTVVDDAAASLARCVHKLERRTPSDVRAGIAPRYRSVFADAAASAIRNGWVELRGDLFFPGSKIPPPSENWARVRRASLADDIRARLETES